MKKQYIQPETQQTLVQCCAILAGSGEPEGFQISTFMSKQNTFEAEDNRDIPTFNAWDE